MCIRDRVQNDIMDNYIKKNLAEKFPNVEIEWEGTGDLTNLLKTYSATGDLPDVWYSDAASATAIINAGNQLNMADYITKDGFIDNYVNPDALYYSDGGIYAISSGIDAVSYTHLDVPDALRGEPFGIYKGKTHGGSGQAP